MKTTIIIPARYESVRFPGKILFSICGKPLIVHVIERVKNSKASEVIVATDNERIAEVVRCRCNVRVAMTNAGHSCGTDRIAEVARQCDSDYILNVQGDELISGPEMIDEILSNADGDLQLATLYTKIKPFEEIADSNIVKVRTDMKGKMIYMSRSPIPFVRDTFHGAVTHYKQVGLYLFQRKALLAFAGLKPTPLEQMEGIELLRALDNGLALRGIYTERPTADVNLPEDIETAQAFVRTHPIEKKA